MVKTLMNGLKKIIRFFIATFYPSIKFVLRPFIRSSHGVKIILFYGENILLVRNTYRTGWTLPGGGIKKSESPRQAAVREVSEEVKINIVDLKNHGTVRLDFEKNSMVTVFSGKVKSFDFEIDGLEIEKAMWVNKKELSKFDILPVGRRCLQLLNLVS